MNDERQTADSKARDSISVSMAPSPSWLLAAVEAGGWRNGEDRLIVIAVAVD